MLAQRLYYRYKNCLPQSISSLCRYTVLTDFQLGHGSSFYYWTMSLVQNTNEITAVVPNSINMSMVINCCLVYFGHLHEWISLRIPFGEVIDNHSTCCRYNSVEHSRYTFRHEHLSFLAADML